VGWSQHRLSFFRERSAAVGGRDARDAVFVKTRARIAGAGHKEQPFELQPAQRNCRGDTRMLNCLADLNI
jgi:hypothetical protein